MSTKILIADDETRMRKLVSDFLKKEGYSVVEAKDGQEALDIFFDEGNIDLAILDIMMPHYDGWSVCREIRKNSSVPIIMLTARSQESDELFGFNLGADEYVTKPFSPKVLVARVNALLKRLQNSSNIILSYNGLEIDENAHYVYVDKNAVNLSPKEFELLLYLAKNEGKVLTREQILTSVWDYNYYGDARTVDTHVKKLRIKLGDKSHYIQTVHGIGYRFEVNK